MVHTTMTTPFGRVGVNETSGLPIAYATAPRKTASDLGIDGGPYAKALADELVKPGVEAVSMFRNVQIRVKQSIGQDPWLSFPYRPCISPGPSRQPCRQSTRSNQPVPPTSSAYAARSRR